MIARVLRICVLVIFLRSSFTLFDFLIPEIVEQHRTHARANGYHAHHIA